MASKSLILINIQPISDIFPVLVVLTAQGTKGVYAVSTNIKKFNMPLIGIFALLTGCATVAQPPQSEPPRVTAQVSEVIEQPELYLNEDIVWGGTVLRVDNRSDETWIEIIQRPLNRNGVPDLSKRSNGRFLAVVPGFLDPLDYVNGRSITVNGIVDGKETRKISEADYTYPVIAVADHQLVDKAQSRVVSNSSSRKRGSYGYYRYPYLSSLSLSFGSRRGSRLGFSFGSRYNYGSSFYGGHRYSGFRGHGFRGHRGFGRGHSRGFRGHRGGRSISRGGFRH